MKRSLSCVSLLVCILLLMSTVSFAANKMDGFTLRNGIEFGDTMDDILKKEKTLVREDDTSTVFSGKIAGYNNAECSFFFDEDTDKLISMNYSFSSLSNCISFREEMNEVYKTLYQSLCRQYGKPEGNTGGSCELITGPAFLRMGLWVYLLGETDGSDGDYVDYDEWVIDAGKFNVKIDLVSYYYRNSSYDYSYFVDLSYHYYTDADYEAALAEKRGEREAVDDDL